MKVGDIATEDIVSPASGEIVLEVGEIVTAKRESLINCVLEDIALYQKREKK